MCESSLIETARMQQIVLAPSNRAIAKRMLGSDPAAVRPRAPHPAVRVGEWASANLTACIEVEVGSDEHRTLTARRGIGHGDGEVGGGGATATSGAVGAETLLRDTVRVRCRLLSRAAKGRQSEWEHPENRAGSPLSKARSPPGSKMMSSNTPEFGTNSACPRVAGCRR